MKTKLEHYYIVKKFMEHETFKPVLLDCFENQSNEFANVREGYYTDNIHKLDWGQKENWNREWVQLLKPILTNRLNEIFNELGFQYITLDALWFQQYQQYGTHGWHIHSSNFTGVYYVELNSNSPKTELLDPITQTKIITPQVSEGDLLVFPSSIIHRAPKIKHDSRKTIISFNITLGLISNDVLEKIK